MNSCLYEVKILHERRRPKMYSFEHTAFMFYIDLAELHLLPAKSRLFGHNRARVYNYREADHIGDIRDFLKTRGVGDRVKRIQLLTHARAFGHIFNPVSFYFCFDADNEPVCVVPEIGNTFGELKYFYLGPDKRLGQSFQDRQTKHYYISPFTELDNVLDFNITVPGDSLNIGIDVMKDGSRFFFSNVFGRRRELGTRNLLWYTLKFPFVTLKVIFLIHWHAFVLHLLKRVPHHMKEEAPDLQRDIGRSRQTTGRR